jgi:hypothetical protein
MEKITCLDETNFRNHRRRVGIKRADRRHHTYLIGKTGTHFHIDRADFAEQEEPFRWLLRSAANVEGAPCSLQEPKRGASAAAGAAPSTA